MKMNKRKYKKECKKFDEKWVALRTSCLFCNDWNCEYSHHQSHFDIDELENDSLCCKEEFKALRFLKKQLKREHLSLSGWKYIEHPTRHIYCFSNDKKKKRLILFFNVEKNAFEIQSSDMLWLYSDKFNGYTHTSIKQALSVPWQHSNYLYPIG